MITANICIPNRLTMEKIKRVKQMEIKQNKATAIYLALDDNSTGQTGMDGNDITAKNNK